MQPHLLLQVVCLDDADGGEGIADGLVGLTKERITSTVHAGQGLKVRAGVKAQTSALCVKLWLT